MTENLAEVPCSIFISDLILDKVAHVIVSNELVVLGSHLTLEYHVLRAALNLTFEFLNKANNLGAGYCTVCIGCQEKAASDKVLWTETCVLSSTNFRTKHYVVRLGLIIIIFGFGIRWGKFTVDVEGTLDLLDT